MREKRPLLRLFADAGPWTVLAVVLGFLVAITAPASAQFFFNFGGPPRQAAPAQRGPGGWFGGDFFAPFQHEAPKRVENYSRAPPAEKRETVPEHNVLVLGDAMADWLAYGLEDAYNEQPDMGVIRRHKTVSGLIRYQPKGEPADWAAAAKTILATEKPDVIVVMLGLNDRIAMREPAAEKSDAKGGDKAAEKKNDKKEARRPGEAPDAGKPQENKPQEKTLDAELPQDEENSETPSVAAPERSGRTANGLVEFRDDRWTELYNKKIDEMIAVLKTKGVPVIWVGLPAVRGAKATSDALFLDSLYRDAAAKAGITYVDVWDGFVDEAGRFLQQGPDFEGQIRRLRSYDGVYFTKAGARKLAHYAEREITRLMASRAAPVSLPSEPATPDANAQPGQPAPRPLAGPIIPLVASSVGTDQLLGGPGSRPAAVDALVARTLVKGEPLSPPAGRADDFAWPRREIAREPAKGDTPVASTAPEGAPAAAQPAPSPKQKRPANAQSNPQAASPSLRNFFGLGGRPQPRQVQPAPRTAPGPNAPRPPANVGRSASVPPRSIAQ
ncbi:SGNH/GDSL hydrolase family protein [Bradyrhizobium sp.]|uniref:SGNH/GDSL hydrolase family protein n=1 Tax=Bradyrhizobium sp. TaxID=376 RepID=UPI00260533D7|nr:SGNH/GDSL hydrolase family protein [Bradyrhizobium sp.]